MRTIVAKTLEGVPQDEVHYFRCNGFVIRKDATCGVRWDVWWLHTNLLPFTPNHDSADAAIWRSSRVKGVKFGAKNRWMRVPSSVLSNRPQSAFRHRTPHEVFIDQRRIETRAWL